MNDRLSERWRRIKRIAGWSIFILLVITQWNVKPWPLFAIAFIIAAGTWQLLDALNQPRLWKFFIIVGGSLNFLAVIANGGRMPVLGRTETARWWEPLTEESRLVPLCDIYAGSSIGDMVVTAALIIGIAGWLVRRKRTNQLVTCEASTSTT